MALPVVIIAEPVDMTTEGASAATLVDMIIMDNIEEAMEVLPVYIAATAVETPAGHDDVVLVCCMTITSNMVWVLLAVGLMPNNMPLP